MINRLILYDFLFHEFSSKTKCTIFHDLAKIYVQNKTSNELNDDASSLFDLEVTVDAAAGDLGGPREVSAAPVAETLPVHTA